MGWPIFFAALRQYVEETVDSHELFTASAERAITAKDLTFRVFVEDAVSGERIGFGSNSLLVEVINRLPSLHFVWSEGEQPY